MVSLKTLALLRLRCPQNVQRKRGQVAGCVSVNELRRLEVKGKGVIFL
jgi:hypothetical protein